VSGALDVKALMEQLGGRDEASAEALPTFVFERDAVHSVLERLRDAGFEQCTLVTATDEMPREPRFRVLWQLRSCAHRARVRVVTHATEDDARVPSAADLWPGAMFSEREVFDMFGVAFDGHPDLRRLLMPEGYDHHPLRKDFPHQGIEPDRLYREWDAARRLKFDPQPDAAR
jgi:NADH-quinone oxidoreductase subunit C